MNTETVINELQFPPPSQVCIVVRDLHDASSNFERLYRTGPFVFPEITYSSIIYRGQAAAGYWEMAFARWGEMEMILQDGI